MIENFILKKYGLPSLEEYKEKLNDPNAEELYYRTFLMQTDHIPNKIVESQLLQKEAVDYTDVLQARAFARSEINRIASEKGGIE